MITSRRNPKLQFIKDLLTRRKVRDESGLFVLDGVRLIEDALSMDGVFSEIYFTENLAERGLDLIQKFTEKNIPVEEVELSIFQNIMETSHSQGIAAVCPRPNTTLPGNLDFVIIADQLRDPGNLGTLLRTAASAGAQAVFTTNGSVDLFSPKVVRSAMGAHFHLPCMELEWKQIEILLKETSSKNHTIYSASAESTLPYWNCDFSKPTVLIIGNEADGISSYAVDITDQMISIPMPGHFESLNAAVAAGIIIFEAARQRSQK